MATRMFRRNPEVLGIETTDVAWATGGLAGSAVGNDKIIAPLIDKFVPTLKANAFLRKIVDGGTTMGVAFVTGWAISKVDRAAGHMWQFGGSILGAGKLVTAAVPGFQISATTPVDTTVAGVFGAPQTTPAQIPGPGGTATPALNTPTSAGANLAYGPDQGNAYPISTGIPTSVTAAYAVGGPAYSLKGGA